MNIDNNIAMKELAEHFRQEQPHLMRYACYRLGYPDDAKDALQDDFLIISEKLSDEKSAEVRDWRNYIFRALSNLCSSRLTASGKLRTICWDVCVLYTDTSRQETRAETYRSQE
jgi:DNA-directed RNA polymerase specialized sigma24 family protein